jgi:hypothetical protein
LTAWLELNNHELKSNRYTQIPINTFITSQNSKSLIDHAIIINRRHKRYLERDLSSWPISQVNIVLSKEETNEYLDGETYAWDNKNLSDHKPLEIILSITLEPPSGNPNDIKTKKSGINWTKAAHKRQYELHLQETINEQKLMNIFSSIEIYQLSSDEKLALLDRLGENLDICIDISKEKTLKTFNLGTHKKKFIQVKSWWTDDIAEIVARRKRLRFLWLNTGFDIYKQMLC